ncbi:hypothetical protein E2C01_017098 [Portunus trituberculatus]|uniref:Uncharacterized protein n=1 Tax=Portunus trituberculatus TaxID=210409 RepID=A0A5B7DS09_PORTR|nr:hypothetical protein [Portunus trituberculatus]
MAKVVPPWYSGTMRALGSEGSPSARVRILSTVRVFGDNITPCAPPNVLAVFLMLAQFLEHGVLHHPSEYTVFSYEIPAPSIFKKQVNTPGILQSSCSSLKAPPHHASQQAFEYTSASRGQHAHHSLPPVQNNNSISSSSSFLAQLTTKTPCMSPSVAKKTRKSLTLEFA